MGFSRCAGQMVGCGVGNMYRARARFLNWRTRESCEGRSESRIQPCYDQHLLT